VRRQGPSGPRQSGTRRLSYDVRFWKIRTQVGKRKTTYAIRWTVGGQEFHKSLATKAQAESRLAELRTAARKGEAFDIDTGLPVSEVQQRDDRSWYEHASLYVERRWPRVGGGQRRSIADTIATATPAMLATDRGQPTDALLRRTMYAWVSNMTRRRGGSPPEDVADAMAWLERNTRGMSVLADQDILDALLDLLALKLDGKPAAANTISRRRSIIYNLLSHAVDDGLLDVNPLTRSHWTAPDAVHTVDPDVVINHDQARALLAAVGEQGEMGPRLVAFFGCMYYSALRPGEAIPLPRTAIQLPPQGWGEFRLRESTPMSGAKWSDTGRSRDRRQLKHRAKGDVRVVPVPPPLTDLLQHHLRQFGTAPDGRLFPAPRGGLLGDKMYGDIWRASRLAALTPAEAASPLARRPYDLRHAAVSTWLNAGVDPTQVAAWAGHSVQVLLQVYAKCIVGRDEIARRRIEVALGLIF
jgi:integrase